MQRATELVGRLDTRLAQAQRAGDLQFFNREYRRRRLAAREAGERRRPSCGCGARSVAVAAGDAAPIMRRVFGG